MSLTINNYVIAEEQIQSVTLRPALGTYDLLFGLLLATRAEKDTPRRASLVGAQISLKIDGQNPQLLGFARPEGPILLATAEHELNVGSVLVLPLHPTQLAALENLRGGGDLDFELLVMGVGKDRHGEHPMQDRWRIHVPRSDWIKRLRDARASDVLLLEVPLPIRKTAGPWTTIARHLRRAEEYFRNGDYHACVASCRTVIQALGQHKFKKNDWSGSLLKRLADNRDDMSKREREAALWGCLRHYTHQAHHADCEGGETDYSRAEATLVLSLTASFVARAQAR